MISLAIINHDLVGVAGCRSTSVAARTPPEGSLERMRVSGCGTADPEPSTCPVASSPSTISISISLPFFWPRRLLSRQFTHVYIDSNRNISHVCDPPCRGDRVMDEKKEYPLFSFSFRMCVVHTNPHQL